MNKILIFILFLILCSCASTVSNQEPAIGWKADRIVEALDNAGRKIADSSNRYSLRLERIARKVKEVKSQEVYIDTKIDLFMLGNHLRVNSGLMDIMRDDELVSLVVKELAHNKLGHYENHFANVTDGYERALEDNFTESQNSSADAFTLNYFIQNKLDPQAVVNAAYKLAKIEEKIILKAEEIPHSTRLVNKSSRDRARALASMLQESKQNEQYLQGLIQVEEPIKPKVEIANKVPTSIDSAIPKTKKPKVRIELPTKKVEPVKEANTKIVEEPIIETPEKTVLVATGVKTASIKKQATKEPSNIIESEIKTQNSSNVRPGWYLQVSAEGSKQAATKKIEALAGSELTATIQEATVSGKTFYRVLVGPYPSKEGLSEAKKSSLVRSDSFPRFVE